jgi:hypothetical protein
MEVAMRKGEKTDVPRRGWSLAVLKRISSFASSSSEDHTRAASARAQRRRNWSEQRGPFAATAARV